MDNEPRGTGGERDGRRNVDGVDWVRIGCDAAPIRNGTQAKVNPIEGAEGDTIRGSQGGAECCEGGVKCRETGREARGEGGDEARRNGASRQACGQGCDQQSRIGGRADSNGDQARHQGAGVGRED